MLNVVIAVNASLSKTAKQGCFPFKMWATERRKMTKERKSVNHQ